MEYIKKEVALPKETEELAEAIESILEATMQAGKDGYQLADLGQIVPVAIAKLPLAVDGMDKIKEELSQDPQAFASAAGLFGARILSYFLKKEEAQPVAAPQS